MLTSGRDCGTEIRMDGGYEVLIQARTRLQIIVIATYLLSLDFKGLTLISFIQVRSDEEESEDWQQRTKTGDQGRYDGSRASPIIFCNMFKLLIYNLG